MAKYKRADDETDGLTYSEEVAAGISAEEVEAVAAAPVDSDDATYKKRYGDLRRHNQQLMADKDHEMSIIKAQLDTAAKGQIKFPKTDDEIEAWSNKYPDVAKIVDTIARKRANEAMEEGDKRMSGLRQLETKLSRKEAEAKLTEMHPDFAKIKQSSDFHDWVALQPLSTQNDLYKNNTDATAASRAIDLYKYDVHMGKTTGPKAAATSVGRAPSPAPSAGGVPKFSESQVEAMSDKEYDELEPAILASVQNQTFNYDISGGAR